MYRDEGCDFVGWSFGDIASKSRFSTLGAKGLWESLDIFWKLRRFSPVVGAGSGPVSWPLLLFISARCAVSSSFLPNSPPSATFRL